MAQKGEGDGDNWFIQECEFLRNGAAHYSMMIYFMLSYVYVLPLFMLCVTIGPFWRGELDFNLGLGFLIYAILTGIAGISAHKRMRSFRNFSRSKRIAPIDKEQMPTVYSIFSELVTVMGLGKREFLFWKSLDLGQTPSVVENGEKVNLVIPIGAIALANRRPDLVKAMLAHELSHVMVGDTHIWTMSEPFARQLLLWLGIPTTISVIISSGVVLTGCLAGGQNNTGSFSYSQILLPAMFLQGCAGILELRRRSEVFADVAGAMNSSPEAMKEAILLCVKPDKVKKVVGDKDSVWITSTHPSRLFRLGRIELIAKGCNPFLTKTDFYIAPKDEK